MGITAYTNISYALLLKSRHRITTGLGPSLRYQRSSAPTYIEYRLEPPSPGTPTLIFEYEEPIASWALGFVLSAQYQYKVSEKFFLGARLMLQNDTRGDVITSQALTFSVRL